MDSKIKHKKFKKPSKQKNLMCREIEGEVVIYNSETDSIHALNSTAVIIWELCDGKHDLSEIMKRITDRFEVEERTVWKDVCKVISELEELKLVTLLPSSGTGSNRSA